jgi:hypothetical protein
MTLAIRIVTVVVMLALWFLTQRLIASRTLKGEGIQDRILDWTAPLNNYLLQNPRWSRRCLIASSLGIDLLGIYIIVTGIFGPSVKPLVGLIILFGLRQICQYLTALPAPPGMIWTDPGFPSLLVTYDVGNDLFFSAHTALTVYGALQLWTTNSPALQVLGLGLICFEVSVVLILRAHWTMDVYAGAVTALLVDQAADKLGSMIDQLLVF